MAPMAPVQRPEAQAEHDFTDDPYWGKGGSYVVDPLTGDATIRFATRRPERS